MFGEEVQSDKRSERCRWYVTHLIDDSDELLLGHDDVLKGRAGFVKVFELPGKRVDTGWMRHRLDQLPHLLVSCATGENNNHHVTHNSLCRVLTTIEIPLCETHIHEHNPPSLSLSLSLLPPFLTPASVPNGSLSFPLLLYPDVSPKLSLL